MTEHAPTRRTVLGTAAGTLTALAGCTGNTVSDISQNQPNAINEVSARGFSVEVTLHDSAKVDSVSVISPSGSEFKTTEVATGATSVVFEIGTEYETGVHKVVASSDGAEVDTASIEIRPEISIREVVVGENSDEEVPEDLPYAEEQILLIVENSGTGADAVNSLTLNGGVPNPTEPDKKRKSGIYDNSDGYGAVKRVAVPVGGKVPLWSTTKPFLFTGDGVECKQSSQEHSATVKLEFDISGEVARSLTIQYAGSADKDSCSVSIAE